MVETDAQWDSARDGMWGVVTFRRNDTGYASLRQSCLVHPADPAIPTPCFPSTPLRHRNQSREVIWQEIVHRKEVEMISKRAETEGTRRGLHALIPKLLSRGARLAELVHDDNHCIDKLLKDEFSPLTGGQHAEVDPRWVGAVHRIIFNAKVRQPLSRA